MKEHYGISDLLALMERLRSDRGCPWDREQNHHTIRNNFLEETYEAVEAIDRDDPVLLKEELGDVLLQVVFHCQMEKESGSFTFEDICDGLCKKLVLRHPHVFGEVQVKNSGEVLNNWDAIKKIEKHQHTAADTLQSVPATFPALMRAQKVQKRAAKAGFDWDDASGAFAKISEESAELSEAAQSGDPDRVTEELGDLLFSCVNVARFVHADAEEALTRSTDKFIARFGALEQLADERKIDLKTASLEELDVLWNEVKRP